MEKFERFIWGIIAPPESKREHIAFAMVMKLLAVHIILLVAEVAITMAIVATIANRLMAFGLILVSIGVMLKLRAIVVNKIVCRAGAFVAYFTGEAVNPKLDFPVPCRVVDEVPDLEEYIPVRSTNPIEPFTLLRFSEGSIQEEIRFKNMALYQSFIQKMKKTPLDANREAIAAFVNSIWMLFVDKTPTILDLQHLPSIKYEHWSEINLPTLEAAEDETEFRQVLGEILADKGIRRRYELKEALYDVVEKRNQEPVQSESNRAVSRKLLELADKFFC